MTIRQNLDSMDRRKRKGTDDEVRELRRRYEAGERSRDMLKDFPWSETQAHAIAKRQARREVR